METREELLGGLNDAVSVIRKLANIQQRLNQVRSQYRSEIPNKKLGKVAKLAIVIIAAACIYMCFTALLSFDIFGLIYSLLEGAVVCGIIIGVNILKNKKIDSDNEEIAVRNEALKKQEQPILEELRQVQIAYQERVGYWYPDNYCSVEAAEFFYDVIKNFRADNIKEAINLYETTLHQRRVEDNQKQAIKQQKLNNLLAVGNLVMQGAAINSAENQAQATRNAINNQTSAINRNADALQSVKDKLSTPKWLR